jgi:asparagine synthase (glutamine-hydrolysing)
MCGIFGSISPDGGGAAVLSKMSQILRHRGPDGEGFALVAANGGVSTFGGPDTAAEVYASTTMFAPKRPLIEEDKDARIAFGHRRLAIVDLSPLGHQPMSSADRQIWIVFNGEIYNHVELRQELESLGHQFASHSDTAVIIEAYREWGVDCLSRFNGMFALVLYDQAKDRVFLARDRFGVKPLNLWSNGRSLYFSSEIKAFLACPNFAAVPVRGLMADYLENGPSEYAVDTLFKGVRRLAAASYIFASPRDLIAGSARTVRWWALDPNPSKEPFDERKAVTYVETYRALLTDAVDLRLRADVQIGSALSGGLDSSSIVYLMAETLKRQGVADLQETFSSVYQSSPEVRAYDESSYIYEIGRLLGVSVNTIEPRAEDVPTEHAKVIWAMDTPPESTCMSGWHTFKLVQQRGVKVTLDGQGADEQLAGYFSYLPHIFHDQTLANQFKAFSSLRKVVPMKSAAGAWAFSLVGPLLRAKLKGRQRAAASMLSGGLNRHLAHDCATNLTNLIHYGDRTSMAFSVESRMPFLDYRLAEFLTRVPEAYKMHDGWTKHPARQAMNGVLPDNVAWRKDKMGWPIPEAVWSRGPLATWFAAPARRQEEFDDLGVGAEFRAALQGGRMEMRVRALNLSAWMDTFPGGGWTSRI